MSSIRYFLSDVRYWIGAHRLVTALAMSCPFAPAERQALLEAPTLTERARTMTTLLEMAVAEDGGPASGARN